MPAGTDAQLKRLTILLERGRKLHYDNAGVLAVRALRAKLPGQMPLTGVLVYKAAQLIYALTFLEERGYLPGLAYDRFTDALFEAVSSPHTARIHGLVQSYAACLGDQDRFVRTVSTDLCAALIGKVDAAYVQALLGSPSAIQRTTQLYCAMTFNDRPMVARLQ